MSEEILKALMQLFAIIAKQDGILIENHEKYVRDFLLSQLSIERVDEYYLIYNEFLNASKPEAGNPESKDVKEKSRTSMKDSVRTLAICKKINKTLAQKQKFIVLIRLLEFFKNDSHHSVNRNQIVETVADVFNIEKNEFSELKQFIFEEPDQSNIGEIIITDESKKQQFECLQFIPMHNYNDVCKFIFIKSINLVILKYHGKIELYLNGLVIKPENIYIFPHGGTLRFPQTTLYYSNIISKFVVNSDIESFTFSAKIKEHKFPSGKVALQELNIEEHSGHLVGIMGASGSGKTTLLNLLSGQDKPSQGEIHINDINLNDKNNGLKGLIGFVPQDDLLIEDLTVYQNLYYNAKLCFKDLDNTEINVKISRTLISLGLNEIKDVKVGSPLNKKISGGQRKRLNIALELIREPHILFLDEPTSGLSSRDSENVMDLLKELSFRGKLIFVVIHQPSSDIFKMFDKIFILDTGGYATYYGNPIEGVMYFKKITNQINEDVGECYACGSVNPETIFNLIELKEIDEYGNYTDKRKIKAEKFYELYREKFLNNLTFKKVSGKLLNTLNIPGRFTQTKIYFLRDVISKLSNKQYVYINLFEVPVLALILSMFIRYVDKSKTEGYLYYYNDNIPAYFFMAILVALLVGLTVSAEEIFKDLKIQRREKFLSLSRFSYINSKILILFILSLIQSLQFAIIGNFVLEIQVGIWKLILMIFSVFCFANLFGLILSSTFNSPVTIYIIIPLIIIPQMVLGGAMFSYKKINKIFGGGNQVPKIANFMITRWAYEGILTDLFVNNEYNKNLFEVKKYESAFNYKLAYLMPKLEEKLNENMGKKRTDELTKSIDDILRHEIADAEENGFNVSENASHMYQIEKLKTFYKKYAIDVSDWKDRALDKLYEQHGGEEGFEKLRHKYHNKHLEEIVTNEFDKDKIVFEDNNFIQVIDPVYTDPVNTSFISLSDKFYVSHKKFFGKKISTFSFNVIIIWVINVFTYLILYYNLPKRLLDSMGKKKYK